jgi:xylulokinase
MRIADYSAATGLGRAIARYVVGAGAAAITSVILRRLYNPQDIAAIGIAYQMHGLVLVDKDQKLLRDSIIWCDSRAVEIGEQAFDAIGHEVCLSRTCLNSPGNFTASKLAWVNKTNRIFTPHRQDHAARRLYCHEANRRDYHIGIGFSEGVFFDFINNSLSEDIINHYFGFSLESLFPRVKDVFSAHGNVLPSIAQQLGLNKASRLLIKPAISQITPYH